MIQSTQSLILMLLTLQGDNSYYNYCSIHRSQMKHEDLMYHTDRRKQEPQSILAQLKASVSVSQKVQDCVISYERAVSLQLKQHSTVLSFHHCMIQLSLVFQISPERALFSSCLTLTFLHRFQITSLLFLLLFLSVFCYSGNNLSGKCDQKHAVCWPF